ncbi:MAG TPA: ferredoxin--NADP reductase [Acidimicrobiales bacterium]|nr:ferredoxin--NADP reductase [Acidimicrobiales bacterium]
MTNHSSTLAEHGYHRLRIKEVVHETPDASSFVLDVPPELTEAFRYRPGQFCTFRFQIDGDEAVRSYSMSSAPETDDDLTVTVKRVDGGLVSNWMLNHLQAGDEVELTKPAGVFCPQDHLGPALGFCGGSGITPFMSITKHLLATTDRPVRLLYANRHASSVIFNETLVGLTTDHPDRLDVQRHVDADLGFLSASGIADFLGDTRDADCYLCGPGPFMDMVESTLLRLGVPPEQILAERFLVEQQEKDATVVSGALLPDEVTVTLGGKTVTVAYKPGDTLLESARRGGLRPPFSCTAGNCATCMAFLHEGTVTMRANTALTPEEVEEGWILTCQSLPTGKTIVVEYENL